METAERRAAAALWCIPGIGPRTLERVRARHGQLGLLLERPVADWAAEVALPGPQAAVLAGQPAPLAALADALERTLGRVGQRAVFPGDPAWPPRLTEVGEAPPVLFAVGPGAAGAPAARAAVVGTRHPEAGVCARIQALAAELAQAGVCVVSGAAEGVDQAAHAGALEAGGHTWAFLGEGIDRLGGARAALAAAMRGARGTLFSQYPPGTPASRSTFRRRNPLISGAAEVVLVARAPLGSGALITAEAALRQGRPLLAIPGDPWNPRATGSNELLRHGQASLCFSASEVLAALGLEAGPARPGPGRPTPVSAEAARLLELVEPGADLDQLAARACLEAGRVSALLLELELAGHLAQRGGGRYLRVGAGPARQSNVDAG